MSIKKKFTDNFELTKVQTPNNKNVFLDIDTNGRLVISTKTGNTGGIHVQGATSTSTFAGSVVIDGDLTVSGTTTTLDTTNLTIEDNLIELNTGEAGPGVTAGGGTAGLTVDRGAGQALASIIYREADNAWDFNQPPGPALTNDPLLQNVGHPPYTSGHGAAYAATQGYVDKVTSQTIVINNGDVNTTLTEEQCKARFIIVAGSAFTVDRELIYPDSVVTPIQTILLYGGTKELKLRRQSGTTKATIPPWHAFAIYHNGSEIIEAGDRTPKEAVGRRTFTFPADADIQLKPNEVNYHELTIAGTLSASREITVALTNEFEIPFQIINNTTAYDIMYSRTPGNGVTIPTGERRLVRLDIAAYEFMEVDIQASSAVFDPSIANASVKYVGSITETNTQDMVTRLIYGAWGIKGIQSPSADVSVSSDDAACQVIVITGTIAPMYTGAQVSIVSGGAGHAVNDVLTISGGTSEQTLELIVTSESGGVITGVNFSTPGIYSVVPANPVTFSATTGSGVGGTFDIYWEEYYRTIIIPDSTVVPGLSYALNFSDMPMKIGRVSSNYNNRSILLPGCMYNILDIGFGVGANPVQANAASAKATVKFFTDADVTVKDESAVYAIEITDPNSVLTTTRNIDYQPNLSSVGYQVLSNMTLQTITYTINGGVGVSVPPGEVRTVINDGIDVLLLPVKIETDSSPRLGGDLDVNGNDITSTSNGDIKILPNGTGQITLDANTWPTSAGNNNEYLRVDGSGNATWNALDISHDTTPQLSGNLDVNGNQITTTVTNGNVVIKPNGSGLLELGDIRLPTGTGTNTYVLKTPGGASPAQMTWGQVDISELSGITLSAAAEGDILIRKESGWVNSVYTKIYDTQFNTTDGTSTVATFEGEAISIASGKVASFEVFVTGYRTGGVAAGSVGDSVYARIHGGIKNVAGTTTIIGTNDSHQHRDDTAVSFPTVVANNTNDTLDVTVQGATDMNITWTVTVYLHIS